MPKVVVEVPLTANEIATILISLELRGMYSPPENRNDLSRLKRLIQQFKHLAGLKS